MDPAMFMRYTGPNGLPQESKLVTYMNRTMTPEPLPTPQPEQARLDLESATSALNKMVISEFVPLSYYAPPNIIPESPPQNSPPNTMMMGMPSQVHQENVGGTTYFYPTGADGMSAAAALNNSANLGGEMCMPGMMMPGPIAASAYATQMYTSNPAYTPVVSNPGLASTFYMPEVIRSEVYQRNQEEVLRTDVLQYPDLPENVEMYSELLPLETLSPISMSSSFRVTHRQTGARSAMRRLHGYGGNISKRLDQWKRLDHPNLVKLNDFFSTKAFNDHSLVLIYDYHSSAATLLSHYLSGTATGSAEASNSFHDPFSSDPDAPRPYTHQKNAMLRAVACGALLPESILWNLIVQITAALRAVHSAGLAYRNLDATKVIVNGCRVRLSWCGTADAYHSNISDISQAQQDDLTDLGRLALSLACWSIRCENLPASLDLLARTYSADFNNLILYLLSTNSTRRSVNDLMPMIGARFYTQVEALERRVDVFDHYLATEIDNGRLLRILIKLAVIYDRPELNLDASWSETGDRYLLKLFRDYVFHAVTSDGAPWLDQAHVTHCLNNLDAGSSAKVELISRDEQSVLVVSYSELKHCLEQSYNEIMEAAHTEH